MTDFHRVLASLASRGAPGEISMLEQMELQGIISESKSENLVEVLADGQRSRSSQQSGCWRPWTANCCY